MTHYPIGIFYSAEDEGYIATFPDLQGCSAFGATEVEALKEAADAKEAWMNAIQKAGNPIPSPSRLKTEKYSGRFLLRLPKELHSTLARDAQEQGVSLNQYVLYRLSQTNNLQHLR